MNGWISSDLEELIDRQIIRLGRGKIISKKDIAANPGIFPIYSSARKNNGKFGEYGDYMFDEELITWSVDGGGGFFYRPKHKFSVTNVGGTLRILDQSILDYKFLYFNLTLQHAQIDFDWVRKAHPSVIRKLYKAIPLPPLPEQQRIVAILDEAFAGITSAVESTEKNLASARELFDSYLNSIDAPGEPLGTLINIKTGKLNANAAVTNGEYPFFTCSREISWIDNYSFDQEAILLAGNNASGDFNVKHYVGKFDAYQRTYVLTVNEDQQVLYGWLYYQLRKSLRELKDLSVGTGTKFLKIGMIKDLRIGLPSIDEQGSILQILENIESHSTDLESIYQQKLDALAELKQPILQKAFSGELTAEPDKALAEAGL